MSVVAEREIGRVRVIMTDSRSERRQTPRTMLGAGQVDWLVREFETAAREAAAKTAGTPPRARPIAALAS